MEEIIKLSGVNKVFKSKNGETNALSDVNLSVYRGEIIGVIGFSGAGKSTLVRCINALEVPDDGKVTVLGQEVNELKNSELLKLRRKIGMIFQGFNLLQQKTVLKNVSFPLEVAGMKKKEAVEQAVKMLEAVQIPNPQAVVRQYPHQLSGGMRQRVMIAMALACKPKILIADEPTTALDVTIQAQILKLMNDLQRENGTSIIFITHDLGVINQMADDVVVMYCGQVVEKSSARTIFTDCPISHPYTEGLMYSIPRLDGGGKRLEPIPGAVPHPLALPKGCKFAPRCKYCTQKCIEEEPPLEELTPGQLVRCFYPVKEERNSDEHKQKVVIDKKPL